MRAIVPILDRPQLIVAWFFTALFCTPAFSATTPIVNISGAAINVAACPNAVGLTFTDFSAKSSITTPCTNGGGTGIINFSYDLTNSTGEQIEDLHLVITSPLTPPTPPGGDLTGGGAGTASPFFGNTTGVANDSRTVTFDFSGGTGRANGQHLGLGIVGIPANATFTIRPTNALHPVPEPSTFAMLAAGLGLLGFLGRRRKL
jgi:hypothetical protein